MMPNKKKSSKFIILLFSASMRQMEVRRVLVLKQVLVPAQEVQVECRWEQSL